MFRADSDNIEEYRRKVRNGVSRLRGLEIADELSMEILSQLVESKKTSSEITTLVYGVRRGEEGFESSYGRIRREIRMLESKGLVCRKLFGRDKPYKLTELATINLARIGGEEKQLPMVPKTDAAFYLATLGSGFLIAALAMGWYQLTELGTLELFGAFCFLFGVSSCEVARMIRRVF